MSRGITSRPLTWGVRIAGALLGAVIVLSGCSGEASPEIDGDGGTLSCDGIDCGGRGECVESDGPARCVCESGFIASGLNCLDDPCSPDPCSYGQCRITGDLALCACDRGYAGDTCNRCDDGFHAENGKCVEGDPCKEDPCVFGVCSLIDNLPFCACAAGTAGDLCERCDTGFHAEELRCVPDTLCSPNPCVFGQCRAEGGHSRCDCEEGYAGDQCDTCQEGYVQSGLSCREVEKDPCDPNPCEDLHKTQCANVGGESRCGCDEGFVPVGDDCLDPSQANPCDPNPCVAEHQGQCVVQGTNALCLCDEGYRPDTDGCVLDENPTTIPVRSCDVRVRYSSASAGPIFIRGTFNGWGLSHPLTKIEGVWEISISSLEPGHYAYKLYDQSNDSWFVDPNNPFTQYENGTQNSRLRIPDCDRPNLVLISDPVVTGGRIAFAVQSELGRSRTPLDSAKAWVKRNGELLTDRFDPQTGVFTLDDPDLAPGKYAYLFEVADTQGRAARRLFVPVWIESTPFDWKDASLYFVLTDRFSNGDSGNDQPVNDAALDRKANWQGGDFAGLLDRIEEGYFERLGINTLWISSPITNTSGAFMGSDNHKYSGYHSYWPTATGYTDQTPVGSLPAVDPHFGTMEDLKTLVDAAHRRGMRVIADFVANHVHADSPVYTGHRNDSPPWFNWNNQQVGQGYVCGWDRPIECWFAEYLPDFDYRNLEVTTLVMEHAIWLVQEANLDGFRMDAVKHMVIDMTRTLRGELDERIDTVSGQRFYMVGETFTGEGEDARRTIKAYVGSSLLDGQFDFPMFWMVVKTLLRKETGLDSLRSFMDDNDGYYNTGAFDAVMSTFMGNHDVPRAISHAAGQIGDLWGNGSKEQGWSSPPQTPGAEDPYLRLRMAWTFLFTQPGIPLIYYGDEIGLPGAGDPDNRRFMIFGNDLTDHQKTTLETVGKLGRARLAHPALRRGTRQTILCDANFWAYVMVSGGDKALVVLNRGGARQQTLSLSSAGLTSGRLVNHLGADSLTLSGGQIQLSIGAMQSALYTIEE